MKKEMFLSGIATGAFIGLLMAVITQIPLGSTSDGNKITVMYHWSGALLTVIGIPLVSAFLVKYGSKKLKECNLGLAWKIEGELAQRVKYELAHAEAVKRSRKFGNVAPSLLQQRTLETVPPSISFSSIDPTKIFRTDAYQTFIRGKVTDNEGVLTLLVNGRKAAMKADGTFAAKLKLRVGTNQITVSAEDINGNVAEKSLTIIREDFIPEETLADVDIPPKTETKNPDGIAIVIGVENYQYVSEATYAYNDAEVFREYLLKAYLRSDNPCMVSPRGIKRFLCWSKKTEGG